MSWGTSPDAYVATYAVQWGDVQWGDGVSEWRGAMAPREVSSELVGPVLPGDRHVARVAAINGNGVRSAWTYSTAAAANPDETPPGPPTNVVAVRDARAIILTWTNDPAPDLARVEVWGKPITGVNDTVDRARLLAGVASDTWTHVGAVGPWGYWLRSKDRTGNVGNWHAALPTTATGCLLGAAWTERLRPLSRELARRRERRRGGRHPLDRRLRR